MSTERDELADILNRSTYEDGLPTHDFDLLLCAADDILAAGYRKPRTVTTAAELDALPAGSVVLDGDGDPWKKRSDGLWLSGRMVEESETVFWCGPDPDDHPTVLHEAAS